VDLPERTGRHLWRGDGGIARLFLDYLDVGVAFKEVGGERVPHDPDCVGSAVNIGALLLKPRSLEAVDGPTLNPKPTVGRQVPRTATLTAYQHSANEGCPQCAHPRCGTGSYIGRTEPGWGCFRGSPVLQGRNAGQVPRRARVFPVQGLVGL
jgi:hypothetical protein